MTNGIETRLLNIIPTVVALKVVEKTIGVAEKQKNRKKIGFNKIDRFM